MEINCLFNKCKAIQVIEIVKHYILISYGEEKYTGILFGLSLGKFKIKLFLV